MLVRLEPSEVQSNWDKLKEEIKLALNTRFSIVSEDLMVFIKAGLIKGNIQAWLIHSDENNYKGLVTTMVDNENLLIFTLTSNRAVISDEGYFGILDELKMFAKTKKCKLVVAYSRVDRMLKMAEKTGGDTSVRFIQWEVL